MASIISGLDTHTSRQVGENLHTELAYSNELSEKIVQFFFQLVRCDDHTSLESIHADILLSIQQDLSKRGVELDMMYKLIGQTRDIIGGKGEQRLAFMQIWGFYQTGYKDLATAAIHHFVLRVNDEHPFGSWKDIKYFSQYVKDKSGDEDHPLIVVAVAIMAAQLEIDYAQYNKLVNSSGAGAESTSEKPRLTLVARWCPRGKSQHAWLHNKIAVHMFPEFMATAKTSDSKRRAKIKCRAHLTKMITTMNKYLNTTQIYQCGGDWKSIDFNNVTSATMRKQSRAFSNKTKTGEERSSNSDRQLCAENLVAHFEACKKDPVTNKVHGRRLNVYELVKDAYPGNLSEEETTRINLQWEDNRKNNKGLGAFIAVADVSYSMHDDEMRPLYSSVGLALRASELTHPAFRNRVLSFADLPVWHKFSEGMSFTDKVQKIAHTSSGLGTNFYRSQKMILDVIVEHDVPPEDVESMVLGIFSDMQINDAFDRCNAIKSDLGAVPPTVTAMDYMYTVITKMYAEAGMRSKYKKPYNPPHLLFWNLRQTKGFPVLSTTKNTSMLSGYSSSLLNAICEKGIDALKEFTPRSLLKDMLNNERYKVMEYDVKEYLSERVGVVV